MRCTPWTAVSPLTLSAVVHLRQALLTILDSPLNKAGRIKARDAGGRGRPCSAHPSHLLSRAQDIFVHTQKNVLFRVSPATRLPRTLKRFCGLMGAPLPSALVACTCLTSLLPPFLSPTA